MSSAIAHTFNDVDIRQRPDDGYVDATAMCQANGKLFADYFRLDTTQAFLQALSLITGIPIIKLVETKPGRYGGTWIHPKAAINLGQWCSPEFAVFVSELVFAWMTGNATAPQNPYLDPEIQGLHDALLHLDLNQSEMRLLLLVRCADAEGRLGELGVEQIMAELGMHKATFYRAVGRLRELGLVETVRRRSLISVNLSPFMLSEQEPQS